MKHFLEYLPNGRVAMTCTCSEKPPSSFGGTVLELEAPRDPDRTVVFKGVPVDLGPRPSPDHSIDFDTRTWVVNLTTEERIEAVRVRLQGVMDAAAKTLGYDDLKSVVSYAEEPADPKFQAEGIAFRAWRSRVWAACYAHPAFSGLAPIPSPDEAEALMPPLEGLP